MVNKPKSAYSIALEKWLLLRILDPSEIEMEEMKVAVKELERLWNSLDLSITPKMHILTTHTINQIIRFGGIGDKVEDFVEKSHQEGKKLDHLVARMKSQCFCQQELVKIRRKWLSNDPTVSSRIIAVNENRKRKFRNAPSMKPKKVLKVEVKAEKRRKVIQRLFDSSSENNNCSS